MGWLGSALSSVGHGLSDAGGFVVHGAEDGAKAVAIVAKDGAKAVASGVEHGWNSAFNDAKAAAGLLGAGVRGLDAAKEQFGSWIDSGEKDLTNKIDEGRGWLRQHGGIAGQIASDQIGFAEGVGESVYGAGKGLVQLADTAGSLANPIEWAANPSANIARVKSTVNTVETLGKIAGLANPESWATDPQGNARLAGALWHSAATSFENDPSKFIGNAAGTIGTLFIPGADVAGVTGDVGRVAAITGDVGKAASITGDVGKAAAITGDAGKAAAITGDAGKATAITGDAGKATAITGDAGKVADGGKGAVNALRGEEQAAQAGDRAGAASRATDSTPGTHGSLRLKYMGATPDKFSRTGAVVVERMRSEGQIVGEGPLLRGNPNGLKLVGDDGTLINIDSKVDMAHRTDAVKWWNDVGRSFGPKSPEVRKFMLDPENYTLQPSSINRSAGARLGETYQPPAPPDFTSLKR